MCVGVNEKCVLQFFRWHCKEAVHWACGHWACRSERRGNFITYKDCFTLKGFAMTKNLEMKIKHKLKNVRGLSKMRADRKWILIFLDEFERALVLFQKRILKIKRERGAYFSPPAGGLHTFLTKKKVWDKHEKVLFTNIDNCNCFSGIYNATTITPTNMHLGGSSAAKLSQNWLS